MKENIPTIKFTIEGTEFEAYEWLTQTEEDTYNSLLLSSNTLKKGDEVGIKMADVSSAMAFLVKSLIKSHTYEQIDIMKPIVRRQLHAKVVEIYNGEEDSEKKSK